MKIRKRGEKKMLFRERHQNYTRWITKVFVGQIFHTSIRINHSSIQKAYPSILATKYRQVNLACYKIKKMTTLETINLLQIICLVIVAFILYLLGFLHGAHWQKRNKV
jgi:hypothetical protein